MPAPVDTFPGLGPAFGPMASVLWWLFEPVFEVLILWYIVACVGPTKFTLDLGPLIDAAADAVRGAAGLLMRVCCAGLVGGIVAGVLLWIAVGRLLRFLWPHEY